MADNEKDIGNYWLYGVHCVQAETMWSIRSVLFGIRSCSSTLYLLLYKKSFNLRYSLRYACTLCNILYIMQYIVHHALTNRIYICDLRINAKHTLPAQSIEKEILGRIGKSFENSNSMKSRVENLLSFF